MSRDSWNRCPRKMRHGLTLHKGRRYSDIDDVLPDVPHAFYLAEVRKDGVVQGRAMARTWDLARTVALYEAGLVKPVGGYCWESEQQGLLDRRIALVLEL